MKQALLSLFCLLSLYSRGQDYIPLLNDNSWYVHFSGWMTDTDIEWTHPVGEVTINDTVYTHYMETVDLSYIFPPAENHYYIREDVEEKKVYSRINNEDRLLYDFSLDVGDQIDVDTDGFPYTFTVVAKDSFAVDAGRKRVRLILEDANDWDPDFNEVWIEGIGSLDHPLQNFEYLIQDIGFKVLCNHYGDEMPYSVNEVFGEPFTCPEPNIELEPDDYIPFINNNSFYIDRLDMLYTATHWTEPLGTSVIGNIEYTHYQENFIGFNENPVQNNYYIREDVEEKKVYKRQGQNEYLMYDFSLDVGDYTMLNVDGDLVQFNVVAKDSFAVDIGRKRVRLILEDVYNWYDGQEVWIEGLGNLHHPLHNFTYIVQDPVYTLLCNHYNGDMPYSVNEVWGQPFNCPEPTSEPEPWPDDYIPLINDNHWYVNSMMFTNMDSYWLQPIEEVTINETAYTHYQETIMVIDTSVVNDYYIREDVEAKRVYKLEEGNEYLMYDFSLEEGDNITLDFAGDLLEYTVVSKDSFAVNIGRQRVRLVLLGVGSEATETWIEGLGNLKHPLKNFLTIIQDPHYTLLCNNYDGEVAYSVNEFIGAPFTCPERGTEPEPPLGVNDYSNFTVSLYPNPFRESFVILAEAPLDNAVLTLHDVLGREIKRIEVSGSEIEVGRENLPAGIYMLRIEQDGEFILNSKVIAE